MTSKMAYVSLSLFALALALPSSSANAKPVKKTYTFGVSLPLTGPVSVAGQEEMKIIEYRLAQINAASFNTYRAVYADDRCGVPASPEDPDYNGGDYATPAKAYEKLTRIEKVNVIEGTICSGAASAMVDHLAADHVLMLSAQNSNASLLEGRSPNYFSLSYSDNDIARRMAVEMCPYATAALITEDLDFTQGLRSNRLNTGVRDFLTTNPVCATPPTIVRDLVFPSSTSDFSALVADLRASGAQVIFVNPNPGATADALLAEIASQLGAWSPKPQLVAGGAMDVAPTWTSGASEGMILVDAPQITDPAFVDFRDAMLVQIGAVTETPDFYMASTLDAVGILTSLLSRFNDGVGKMRDAIATETMSGWIDDVTSSHQIVFDGNTFVQGIVAAKFVVHGGVPEPQP